MDDDVFRALDGVERFADEVLPRLDEYLDGYVVWDMVPFNQLAADFVFRFRSGREPDFDFFKAHVAKRVEELELFF